MPRVAFAPVLTTNATFVHNSVVAPSRTPKRSCPYRTPFLGTHRARNPTLQTISEQARSPRRHRSASMSLQKVVIAGGTGFIGSHLAAALLKQGISVTVLSRSASSASKVPAGVNVQVWAPDKLAAVGNDWMGWESALANADLVVNIAGERVVSRWDDKGRRGIFNSRVSSTTALVKAIAQLPPNERPRCMVSASGVGYYGVSNTADFDEMSSSAKDDFLADVCVQWEKAATEGLRDVPETRLVIVRIGVVMGVGGGAFERMRPAFQRFVGGPIGSGQQWVSWVHIDDLVRVFTKAGEDETMSGVYNGTGPEPVTMGRLSKALAGALNRPNLVPVPGLVLKFAYGDGSSVILEGQKVLPKRLLQHGFQFDYADVDSAMKALAKEA